MKVFSLECFPPCCNVQSLCAVLVKMPTGKITRLEVSHPCTVEDVKQKISWREGIPPHSQRLTYNRRVLEDGVAVYDYNIRNGSKLELTVLGSKYVYTLSSSS